MSQLGGNSLQTKILSGENNLTGITVLSMFVRTTIDNDQNKLFSDFITKSFCIEYSLNC